MILSAPAASFEAVQQFATGLAGTVGVRIIDNAAATVTARTTSGVSEYPAGSGIYQVTLTAPSSAGQFTVVWDDGSTYAVESLVVGYSAVVQGASSPAYITSAQLKATLTLTGGTFADADIAAAINAASRAIDNICHRRFYADADAAQIRYYSPDRPDVLEIDDLVALTSLQSADDGTTTFANTWTLYTDFVLEPLDAQQDTQNLQPFTRARIHPTGSYTFNTYFPRSVKLTGKFGWAACPDPIVDATTLLAGRLVKMKREAPLGIIAYDGVAVRVARQDSQVMSLVGPYVRHRSAVG